MQAKRLLNKGKYQITNLSNSEVSMLPPSLINKTGKIVSVVRTRLTSIAIRPGRIVLVKIIITLAKTKIIPKNSRTKVLPVK